MNTRGPAPKTAEQARLAGDKRRMKDLENVPRCTYEPLAPEYLDGAALDMWNHLMAVTPPGLYTAMDMPILVLFCETWQQRDMLRGSITKSGMGKGSKKQAIIHPSIKAMRELTATLSTLAKQLLLTPADRARLGGLLAPPPPDAQEAAPAKAQNGSSAAKRQTPKKDFQSLIGPKG